MKQETREKISQAMTGKTKSKEEKNKISQGNAGKERSPEAKEKYRQARLETTLKKNNLTWGDIHKIRALNQHGFTFIMIHLRFPQLKKLTLERIIKNRIFKEPTVYVSPQEGAKTIDKNLKLPRNYSIKQ